MSTSEPLALAVVGVGRAGRARLKSIENCSEAKLAGVVRRQPDASSRSWASILEDAAVDGVILCTPNAQHSRQAREALEQGKHVLVEFPLAQNASEAEELFELAAQRERVLHVEHIELLSASQLHQRARVEELGRPQGGELYFTGSNAGWIGSSDLAGSPALRALARLHRLVDLFGEARVSDAQLTASSASEYRLVIGLEFEAGGQLSLVEERGPDLPRSTRWAIRCEKGPLDDPPGGAAGALFEQDLQIFIDRVRRGVPHYVSDARVVHVLDLVGQAERKI